MKTEADKQDIAHIQLEVNSPKQRLMKLADAMVQLDRRKAESLNRIIARLEAWQNS